MPGRKPSLSDPPVSKNARPARPATAAARASSRAAVLVIDQGRLQSAAWARVHTARKRLEKASRDLHRHEEIDAPGYESWLHRTFPLLVTTLRELHEQAAAKTQKIQRVQAMAYFTGRSVKRVWREEKEREIDPERFEENVRAEDDAAGETFESEAERDEAPETKATPPRSRSAREIYRRLVQRLHPDRGGEWTAADQRLWHQVQQAWAAGDADWLARLEVDWESAHEVLGPSSPLSRLYRAIEELDAARRDTERKLRSYRSSPAWRFSLTEKKRAILRTRIEAQLHREIGSLRRHLRPLDAIIEAFEDDWTRSEARAKTRRRRAEF